MECWKCGIRFGTEAGQFPTVKPLGSAKNPSSSAPAPATRKATGQEPGQSIQSPVDQKWETEAVFPRRPARRFYGAVIILMLAALISNYLYLPALLAFPPARGAMFAQTLQVLLEIRVLKQPVPAMLSQLVPAIILRVLFWVQVALLARRLVISVRAGTVVVPASLTAGWIVLFSIGFLSWLIGTMVFLSPVVLHALAQNQLAWAVQVANTLMTSVLYIPAANIFGVSFFFVEILALKIAAARGAP